MSIKYKRIFYSLVFLCCLTYIMVACYKISSPGVHYDELLFVNAACGDRVGNSFIAKQILGVPVMLMTYIGALKSYIYFPIFEIFGISVWSIRLPVILITVFSLIIISRITNKIFNWYIATLVLLFLAIDPSFISLTRLDVGPNALELFLKCCSLVFFYRYFIENRAVKNLVFGLLILGLGLFNKLNFIWFINALYCSIIFLNLRIIIQKMRSINKKTFTAIFFMVLAYLVFAGYFLSIYLGIDQADLTITNYRWHFQRVFGNVADLLNGSILIKWVYGEFVNTMFNSFIWYLIAIVILIGLFANVVAKYEFVRKSRKWYLFLWVIIVVELIQILITKKAIHPWHVFTLYPFFTVLFAYSIYSGALFLTKSQPLRIIIISSIALLTLVHQSSTLSQYLNKLGSPTKPGRGYSEMIYDLIAYTKSKNKKFVSIDWALHNNLIAFDHKKGKYFQLSKFWSPAGLNDHDKEKINKYFFSHRNVFYISHADGKELCPIANKRFRQLVSDGNLRIHVEKVFRDRGGPVYIVYSLKGQRYSR